MRTDSGKSTASEAGGSEVLYLKDNVAIHPTQYASERISGRLRLYKQGSSLFLVIFPLLFGIGSCAVSQSLSALFSW
ncbi:hypothetical protein BHM03_00054819 [Ensete ventricosum]|nr:hypothetical protein BHM03_00054819 [Ensete ventricosum]